MNINREIWTMLNKLNEALESDDKLHLIEQVRDDCDRVLLYNE